MTRILAIDPGPDHSAWLEFRGGHPGSFGIWPNEELLSDIRDQSATTVVIEQIRSFGMAVGAEVFDTVHWSGRFHEAADYRGLRVELLPRLAVKQAICHDSRAKDANIRAALIDRFGGPAAIRKGGALYGVSKDVWSALALAVTYSEIVG